MPRTVSFEPSTLEKLGTFLMQSGGVLGNVARQRVDDEEIRQRTLERLARMLEGLQGQQFQAQHLELQQQRLTAQQAEAARQQAREAQEQETVTGAMGPVTEEISPARMGRPAIPRAEFEIGDRMTAMGPLQGGPPFVIPTGKDVQGEVVPAQPRAPAVTRERAPELPEILQRLAQAASRGRGVPKARLEDIKGLFPAEEKPSLQQFDPTRPVFRVKGGEATEIRPGVPAEPKPLKVPDDSTLIAVGQGSLRPDQVGLPPTFTAEQATAILDRQSSERVRIAQANSENAAKMAARTPAEVLGKVQGLREAKVILREIRALVPQVDLPKIAGGLAPWFNRIAETGRIGPIPFEGTKLAPAEAKFLQLNRNYVDSVLRLRSGAQINEQEFQRMLGFLGGEHVVPEVLVVRLDTEDSLLDVRLRTWQETLEAAGYRFPGVGTPSDDVARIRKRIEELEQKAR